MIEADGSDKLREVSDVLEEREVQVEWALCPCGDHLKSVFAPSIQAEWLNVALSEECAEEAREISLDRNADWAIDDARLVG